MTDFTSSENNEMHRVQVPRLERRHQIRLVAIIVLAVLLLFVGGPLISRLLFPSAARPASRPDDGSFVATQKQGATLHFERVHLQSFENAVTTDGKIAVDDDRTTQIFSPYTGRVTHIFAKAGDIVKAGAPLFSVIANEAAQSDADIRTAAAQARAASSEEARLRDLVQHQGAAQKDWEQSRVDLATAQALLHAAKTRRAALGGTIEHGEAVVLAPVPGVIIQRLIGVGQNLAGSAGGSPTQTFSIGNFSQVWIVGNLREEDAMKAHVGQEARVRLLAAPEQPLEAHINYVAPTLDPLSRRLTVRATLANPDGRLKPEMFATFSLLTGGARTELSVPTSAVIYEGSTARVWVANSNGRRLWLRNVVAGSTDNDRVEILSGLKDGDTVVTAGALFIDRGAKAD
jgi:cobalt-zinc-cadmium efflux system membrane fusion protein